MPNLKEKEVDYINNKIKFVDAEIYKSSFAEDSIYELVNYLKGQAANYAVANNFISSTASVGLAVSKCKRLYSSMPFLLKELSEGFPADFEVDMPREKSYINFY